MTAEEALGHAWTYCAPGRMQSIQFPSGFWPDVARVAIEMYVQQTTNPRLDFRPTRCDRGDYPEPKTSSKKLKNINVSALKFNI